MDDAPPPGPVGLGSMLYDVFLSFQGGSDVDGESFPARLHASLAAAGVSVCGPDESQAVGSSSRLPDVAVQGSKICIPILSTEYPSSERCLSGLVQMMEGKRNARQMVLPIFNVEPSHVRYQKESFREALSSDIGGVQGALFEVSMLHGWKVIRGHEEELVKTVVQTVLTCMRPRDPRIVQYNVFLNFRGADTRQNFAYHLYTNLAEAGVSVFKDDIDLVIGEKFDSQLLDAISGSTIYFSILSQGYASSDWCLLELAKMIECHMSNRHVLLPIFYGVNVWDVKSQSGSFGDAFHLRERRRGMDTTKKGRQALREVGKFKLWEHGISSEIKGSERGIYRPDGELIEDLVRETLTILRYEFQLDVPEHVLRARDVVPHPHLRFRY